MATLTGSLANTHGYDPYTRHCEDNTTLHPKIHLGRSVGCGTMTQDPYLVNRNILFSGNLVGAYQTD